jgi:hypothetical protein
MSKRIRVTSGECAGRYIGLKIGRLRTNPDLIKDSDVFVPGTKWALYLQQRPAFVFFDHAVLAIQEAQAQLKGAGYDSEVESIESPKVESKSVIRKRNYKSMPRSLGGGGKSGKKKAPKRGPKR